MNEEQKTLKKEILKALIDRDWTPTNLAEAMGISRMDLNDLINFRRKSDKRINQIKEILEIG